MSEEYEPGLVSVVIPLYNKERHIARAIQSVLNQTIGDFELIVVNDGSTDRSAEVVNTFTDPRIRLVHREHINSWGGHAARNLGIAEARAELIAFLDADDEWLPEHLVTIKRLSAKYPECGAYATTYEIVDADHRRRTNKFKDIPKAPWEGIVPNYFNTISGNFLISSSSVAVWKYIFEKVAYSPVGVKRSGDGEMWCRIALKYQIAFSNYVGSIYYMNAENRVDVANPMPIESRWLIPINQYLTSKSKHALPMNVSIEDIVECRNYLLILSAMRLIIRRQPALAREKLRRAFITKRYRCKLILVYLVSLIPDPLFSIIRYFKGWPGYGRRLSSTVI